MFKNFSLLKFDRLHVPGADFYFFVVEPAEIIFRV